MKNELRQILDDLRARVEETTDGGRAGVERELATFGLTLDEFDALVEDLFTGAIQSGTVADPYAFVAAILITGLILGRELEPKWQEAA